MNTKYYRTLLVFAVMILLVMVNVGVVFADKPIVIPRNGFFEQTLDCGTFYASELLDDTLRIREFYDDNGLLVRAIVHQVGTATFTNPLNGNTLTAHTGANFFWNFTDSTQTKTGVFTLYIPGVGTIDHDIGIVTYNWALDEFTFEGGDNPFWKSDDYVALLEEVVCPLIE